MTGNVNREEVQAALDAVNPDLPHYKQVRAFVTRTEPFSIENGMFVELQTMEDYRRLLLSNELHVTHREVLNQHCAKTWDISLDIIKDKTLWALAARHGAHFIKFLKAFQAMRAGFASGNFVYGLLVASANSNA